MNLAPQFLLLSESIAIGIMLVLGVYWSCRELGICSNHYVRLALLWGGGFLVYAVVDYYLLLR